MIPNVESSSSNFSIHMVILFFYERRIFEHGVLTHSSNYIPIRLAEAHWSFDHSECNMIPNVESSSSSFSIHTVILFFYERVRYLSMIS